MWPTFRNALGKHSRKSRARRAPSTNRPLRTGLTLEALEVRSLMAVLFVGDETRAYGPSQAVSNNQQTFAVSPTPVAMSNTGKALITYSGPNQNEVLTGNNDVLLQVVSPTGALDTNLTVNTTTAGDQSFGNVAVNPTATANYVVVWSGRGDQTGQQDANGVFMQRFSSSNTRSGSETLVNTTTTANVIQSRPAVAMDANGNYVVTWVDERTENNVFRRNIYLRQFNSAGAPIINSVENNTQERVLSASAQDQRHASVAMGAGGSYLVVWSEFVGGLYRAFGRYFTPTNVTAPFPLSDAGLTANQFYPTAAIDDSGDFIVSWTETLQGFDINDLTDNATNVFVRRFNAPVFGSAPVPKPDPAGNAAAQIVPNSDFAGGTQRFSRVAVDRTTGDYTIVWDGVGPTTSKRTTISSDPITVEPETADTEGGVFGERFRDTGAPIGATAANPAGGLFRANTTTPGRQRMSGIALRSEATPTATSANIIVAWSGNGTQTNQADTQGVFFQRFQRDTTNFQYALNGTDPVDFSVRTLTPVLLAPEATVNDANALEYNGLVLNVVLSTTGTGTDALAAPNIEFLNIRNEGVLAGQIGVNGNVISFGGVPIATFAFAADPVDPLQSVLTVTFNQAIMNTAGFRNVAVQAVLRNIQYQHTQPKTTTPLSPDRLTEWTFVLVDNRDSATLTKSVQFTQGSGGGGGGTIFRHRGFCDSCPLPSVRYATSLYNVLLEREGSDAEINALAGALRNGYPATAAVAGFLNSPEYRRWLIADPVNGFYPRYLGRQADEGGIQFWLNAMAHGVTEQQVLSGIVGSNEFFVTQGSSTNTGYVTALYTLLLERTTSPSAAEINFYVSQLNAGRSRADVAAGFIFSTEYETQIVNEWFFHYLDQATPNSFYVGRALAAMNVRNSWHDAQTYILTTTFAIPRPLILG